MQLYGLIGYPLDHSFSPAYFRDKFQRERLDARYIAFPLDDIRGFRSLTDGYPELLGLNVTIPHKEAILPYLDVLDSDAKTIGAVNCIHFGERVLTGFNTDWLGFRDSLLPLLRHHHTRALVLGSGGASKAVCFALGKLGIEYTLVARRRSDGAMRYTDVTAAVLASHTIVVNTTPLGMHPAIETFLPLPYDALGPQHLLYDLVYNPLQTRFLALGEAQGAATKNGFQMLELQAEAAWKIWTPPALKGDGL